MDFRPKNKFYSGRVMDYIVIYHLYLRRKRKKDKPFGSPPYSGNNSGNPTQSQGRGGDKCVLCFLYEH